MFILHLKICCLVRNVINRVMLVLFYLPPPCQPTRCPWRSAPLSQINWGIGLDVKGSNLKLKKGMVVKNIKLTDDPDEVDCKVEKQRIVLRTEFLKKA